MPEILIHAEILVLSCICVHICVQYASLAKQVEFQISTRYPFRNGANTKKWPTNFFLNSSLLKFEILLFGKRHTIKVLHKKKLSV